MPEHVDLQKAKKIVERDWTDIRTRWIDHVPDFSEPGVAPESTLAELPSLDERLTLQKTHTDLIEDNLPGLRQGVLHEGIYLFHKAAHIFGASLVHAEKGMCTWSLSSAYHSAYFAMKGILCLLGVAVVETDERGIYLVDVWHAPQQGRRRRDPIVFLYRSGKIEHGELWACFQRALDKTSNFDSVCRRGFRDGLLAIEANQFAQQRNILHYRTVWNGDDLHACVVQEHFGKLAQGGIDPVQADFLLVLAFGMMHIGQRMLGELAPSSKPLLDEKLLIDTWLDQPFNRLYHENTAVVLASE